MLPTELDLSTFPPIPYDLWRQQVERDLAGAPFDRKLVRKTDDGLTLQPLYSAEHYDHSTNPAGLPGDAPLTRGSTPWCSTWRRALAYRRADLGKLANALREDTARGCDTVLLQLDLALRLGKSPQASPPDVAADGIPLHSAVHLARVLEGVSLRDVAILLQPGGAFLPAAGMLAAVWKMRNVTPDQATGSFGADPLGSLARDGVLPNSLETALAQLGALATTTARDWPRVRSTLVDTSTYHAAGATAAQDLGLALATGATYLRALTAAGLSLTEASRQISFRFELGTRFFQAIAKLRAARMLWSRVLSAAGADTDAQQMRIEVRTAHRVLTKRDPWINMLRNTAVCFAGACGGADTIITEPFDAALQAPSALARRVARNTQSVLHEESHLGRVQDPAGGSWFIESHTQQLAERAWSFFQQLERDGLFNQLQSGWVADQIATAYATRATAVAMRKIPITGISEFPLLDERPAPSESDDHVAARDSILRELGDADNVNLAPIKHARSDHAATCSAVFAALAAGAPTGAVGEALHDTPTTLPPFAPEPLAQDFETLRDAADAKLSSSGHRPNVFLANLGPIAVHTARATFAENFFHAGGFDTISNKGFDNAETAAQAFQQSGSAIAVICSSDKLYAELAAPTAQALKRAGARTVILAGHPGDAEQAYRDAGIDRFIYLKCDVLDTLRTLLAEEGVLV